MTDQRVLTFKSIEDKVDYWKNKTKQLEATNVALEAENRELKTKRRIMSDKEGEPVKEKIRIAENMDPFNNRFPPHCIDLIMSHIKIMKDSDLYKMSKVSSEWKQMLENHKDTRKKIKDFLTIGLTIDLKTLVQILGKHIDIEYAHMVAHLNSACPLSHLHAACLIRYSPFLENLLLIDQHYGEEFNIPDFGLVFSRLRSLNIGYFHDQVSDWIGLSKFPAFQELIWEEYSSDDYSENGFDFLSRLLQPNLKKLVIGEFSVTQYQEKLINLESLEIGYFNFLDVDVILMKLTKLKSLTLICSDIYEENESLKRVELTKNTSITFLALGAPLDNFRLELLKALPALKTFIILFDRLTKKCFDIIVRHHLKLKKIICHTVEENLLEEYEEMKKRDADNDLINTDIEIIIKNPVYRYIAIKD